jgi:hypothetical protein
MFDIRADLRALFPLDPIFRLSPPSAAAKRFFMLVLPQLLFFIAQLVDDLGAESTPCLLYPDDNVPFSPR